MVCLRSGTGQLRQEPIRDARAVRESTEYQSPNPLQTLEFVNLFKRPTLLMVSLSLSFSPPSSPLPSLFTRKVCWLLLPHLADEETESRDHRGQIRQTSRGRFCCSRNKSRVQAENDAPSRGHSRGCNAEVIYRDVSRTERTCKGGRCTQVPAAQEATVLLLCP